jgi:hypothetical protein
MAAKKRRKVTERGIGKSGTSRPPPSSDAAGTPDANDAKDARLEADDDPPASVSESRAPRHATLEQGFVRSTTRRGIPPPRLPVAGAAPASTSGVSAPPPSSRGFSAPPPSTQGRYSQQPGAQQDVAEAWPSASSASPSRRTLPSRQPLRVEGHVATSTSPESPGAVKPRIIGSARIAGASLTSREAFVLGLIDGATTVQDLVDAAGISEPEVMAILASLTRLGIVTTTSA